MLAVLPKGTPIVPVGGIGADNLAAWRAGGAAGFGLGSSLYKPGDDAASDRVAHVHKDDRDRPRFLLEGNGRGGPV